MNKEITISLRLDDATAEKLEKLRQKLQAQTGVELTTSEVVRWLIRKSV